MPDNNANTEYNEIITTYADARNIDQTASVLDGITGFVGGVDYEKLEKARKLSPSEYTVNSALGYVSLKSSLQTDQVLAVAFEFPDPKFRALLLGRDYDRNGDGTLDKQEIIYLRNIYCQNMGIKSLKGIEYLKELRGIYCMDNEIADWDLSHNKLLTGIWCSGNKFSKLDFTGLDDLIWVYCHDNPNLTTLNVRNNPKMAYIECNTTPLKDLDVTQNPELEHLCMTLKC